MIAGFQGLETKEEMMRIENNDETFLLKLRISLQKPTCHIISSEPEVSLPCPNIPGLLRPAMGLPNQKQSCL